MTVRELIVALSRVNPDALVLGRGYESGFDLIRAVALTEVVEWYDGPGYEGMYQEADGWLTEEGEFGPRLDAVTIGR